jgi:multicomponent K+:H+ antiporter subunit C
MPTRRPGALVLTAIVISFGMTAIVVLIAPGPFLEADTDAIDMAPDGVEPGSAPRPADPADPADRPSAPAAGTAREGRP